MLKADKTIKLAHGNGGKYTHDLIDEVFTPAFNNKYLAPKGDSAILSLSNRKLAFSTDSHVIKPLFIPGTDIGKLAVCGTANDLAVAGAVPKWLSCGFIIEEGFLISDLKKIVESMGKIAAENNIKIVTGDTKVVEKGAVDGVFINTAGVGEMLEHFPTGVSTISAGDRVIISGTLGDHGMAVYAAREEFFESKISSDCAVISPLTNAVLQAGKDVKIMSDPTRGGLASTLCEFAVGKKISIQIDEDLIPMNSQVSAACELLGFDPLYLANEGKVVFIVSKEDADDTLQILKNHTLGTNAAIIGEINEKYPGKVYLNTQIGGERIVDMLLDDLIPRIC
jgi:hydrogenase expression/formation protein HypE